MIGVPVIPSGSMLPQGWVSSGTGRPSSRLQIWAPDFASIARTVSSSVATISIPAGCQ
jgi:hypothetical protein